MVARLLKLKNFADHCQKQGISVNKKRLLNLERLGAFKPIVRFVNDGSISAGMRFPNSDVGEWFDQGIAIDCLAPGTEYNMPAEDVETEAFYSPFQIFDLICALTGLTINVQLDEYLEQQTPPVDWQARAGHWVQFAEQCLAGCRNSSFRAAVSVLCQYISNRYYPHTQGNRRTISVPRDCLAVGGWINIIGVGWQWEEEAANFDPKQVETEFQLTERKLEHAYNAIATAANSKDPIEKWANLVEFISIKQKNALKGDALLAFNLRCAANMIRRLHKDLYGVDLPPSHEVNTEVISHSPELEQRDDCRRHLEFVVNQYDLNPQPKLVLLVEGESEVALIDTIFQPLFGHHPGTAGIEIINLRGVDNATGNKKYDRFTAIVRLIDYLHHHQSMTYLLLDDENYARKLQEAAEHKPSLLSSNRLAMAPDHVRLWGVCLEFDNFSNTEIAKALTKIGNGAKFSPAEIALAREDSNPGKSLSDIYAAKTSRSLNKPDLARVLGQILIDPKTRKKPAKRPIVEVLRTARKLAVRNPFPTTHEIWVRNQNSSVLGGQRVSDDLISDSNADQ